MNAIFSFFTLEDNFDIVFKLKSSLILIRPVIVGFCHIILNQLGDHHNHGDLVVKDQLPEPRHHVLLRGLDSKKLLVQIVKVDLIQNDYQENINEA